MTQPKDPNPQAPEPDEIPRHPRAFDPDDARVDFEEPLADPAAGQTSDTLEGTAETGKGDGLPAVAGRPTLGWLGLFLSATFGLAVLATGLWFSRFVSVALSDQTWLGWIAWGLVGLAALAALVLTLREIIGFFRLARLTRLRRDAEAAIADQHKAGGAKQAKSVIKRLKVMARKDPALRWDLAKFREEERHMESAAALLGLADRALLSGADAQARAAIYRSARRVGVVTAVVPVAFLVVAFVLFENLAMVRRLAGAYGGRPGFFGGVKLFWWIIGHIAATGAVALTDDLFGQFLGQDVARRVSRRLGEGAFNGALTARLGVAAMGVCRPLPFLEARPPRVRDILREVFPEINAGELMRATLRRPGKAKAETQ